MLGLSKKSDPEEITKPNKRPYNRPGAYVIENRDPTDEERLSKKKILSDLIQSKLPSI